MVVCKFNDISEKDMDLIFLEEFVSEPKFASLFLEQIGMCSASVIGVEHSKMDMEFGESDMTVIVEKDGVKHALLIEDKIDAIAMPNQAARYFERGKLGVQNEEYEKFDVFIVAPEKYLADNEEAHKYPFKVSYEMIATYFEKKGDARSVFKSQMILQAINKQKKGYQMRESKEATEFWNSYIDYQKEHYPSLWLTSTKGPRSITSTWTWFKTVIDNVLIYHKCDKGFMDLTFPNQGNRLVEFEKELIILLGKLEDSGVFLVKTGKSVALRIEVPAIDIKNPFDEHIDEVDICLKAAEKLSKIAKKL